MGRTRRYRGGSRWRCARNFGRGRQNANGAPGKAVSIVRGVGCAASTGRFRRSHPLHTATIAYRHEARTLPNAGYREQTLQQRMTNERAVPHKSSGVQVCQHAATWARQCPSRCDADHEPRARVRWSLCPGRVFQIQGKVLPMAIGRSDHCARVLLVAAGVLCGACAAHRVDTSRLSEEAFSGHVTTSTSGTWFTPCGPASDSPKLWVTFTGASVQQAQSARASALLSPDGGPTFVRWRASRTDEAHAGPGGPALLVREILETRAPRADDCTGPASR